MTYLIYGLLFLTFYSVNNIAAAKPFDIQDLQNLVIESKPTNVQQFLDELALRAPAMRRNYVLVYNSRSLHDAEYIRPRVISYSEDAKLIVAYQGWSNQNRQSNSIEIISFDDEKESFSFFNLNFSDVTSEKPAVLSPPNPKLCLSCHKGPDPRPNWEQYPLWPGVYKSRPHPAFEDEELGLSEGKEADGYRLFLDEQANKGRYRFLDNPKGHYLAPQKSVDYEGSSSTAQERVKGYTYKPNIEFSQKVGWLNIRRLARRISSLKIRGGDALEVLGVPLMGALNEEDLDSKDFAPLDGVVRAPFTDVWADLRLKRTESHNGFTNEYYHREIAGLLYLLEPYDLDPKDWTTSFLEPSSFYSFVMPSGSLPIYLSARLAEIRPQLAPYARYKIVRYGNSLVGFSRITPRESE